ncbi:MAG: OsmC family protein [Acidimicrobiales bacterium]
MTETADAAPAERNGVPTEKLFGTIAKMKENGELAAFRFSARNEWVEGTASRSSIYEWYGAGADQVHVEEFDFVADHPTLGHGHGPTPQEYVLHALAACITAGVATGAAARDIELQKVSSKVSADIDVRGVLGIDPDIRKGFSDVRVEFDVEADAEPAVIDALVASATKYSAVYDMLTSPTSVTVTRA